LHSWRGGLGNTCFFDEHTHPPLCASIAEQLDAEAVVTLSADSPLISTHLIDGMLEHFAEALALDETRMVFAQAPPGLAPTVFHRELLNDISASNVPAGWINAYRPDNPRADMITTSACYRLPLEVQHATGRLTSDTRRGFELLQSLHRTSNSDDLAALCRESTARAVAPEPLPRELHIELCTDDPLPDTTLRPRGPRVPQRAPMTLDLLERCVSEAAAYDDTLVVLGGFGEPLSHPRFIQVLETLRQYPVYGVAVRSSAVNMTTAVAHALVEHDIDIFQALIDAATPQQYAEVHGMDAYGAALAGIEMLIAARRSAGRPNPNILPTLTKATTTLHEMDRFFDHWTSTSGWAVIEGFSHHAGLLPDLGVMSMAPPRRRPCRQLRHRCTILSNGDMTACDQDYCGRYVLGNLEQHTLAELWQGERMTALRRAHDDEDYTAHPMCAQCEEWQRP
jgi:radical SAM protein with 4Fe4S-binding SPASM domain